MPEMSSVPSFLEGVYIGLNAVPDTRLILDAPVGCNFKSERVGMNHDFHSTLFHPLGLHRVITTVEHPQQLISGTLDTLREKAIRIMELSRPSVLFISEVTALWLEGNEVEVIARDLTEDLGIPVVYVKPDILGGDFLDGFETFLARLTEALPLEPPAKGPVPNLVGIVGYMPDRLEGDHRANVAVLRDLVRAAGLEPGPVLLDGSDVADLTGIAHASILLELPLSGGCATALAARTGARVIPMGLPVGLEGTTKWIADLAEAAGSPDEAGTTTQARLRELVPLLDRVREMFLQDHNVAIAAPPDLLPGLLEYVHDLGMECGLVAARCRDPKRLGPVRDVMDRLGMDMEILVDYRRSRFRQALNEAHHERPVSLVIGSTSEAVAAREVGAGLLEVGYPSYMTHALTPRPLLGFDGAARLVEEMVNVVLRRDFDNGTPG